MTKQETYLKARRNAIRRCTEPTNNRYKYYGAKGIQCLLSREDILFLAQRDHADQMRKPQLHREDTTGSYTLDNCTFVEASEHSRITHTGAKRSAEAKRKMSIWPHAKGEQHPNAILTKRAVEEIRQKPYLPWRVCASMFNCSRSTVYAVRSGKVWKK